MEKELTNHTIRPWTIRSIDQWSRTDFWHCGHKSFISKSF